MGTAWIYHKAHIIGRKGWSHNPYFSLSLSLNVILTLMLTAGIVLKSRPSRAAGIDRYRAIVVMLVESCALYAVSSLLVIGPWAAGNNIALLFLAVLGETQVRAFPQPRPSDRFSDVTMYWIGHRPTTDH